MQVLEKPTIITQLSHNLSFTNDEEVNQKLLTRYRLYDYLTPNDTANKLILQSVIDEWSDYCNKLYATTLYEYNPIWNVDGTTETTRKLEYGKVDTRTNGLVVTTEQKTVARNETHYGRIDTLANGRTTTTEQLTDGTVETEYGKVTTDAGTHHETDGHANGSRQNYANGYDLTASTPTNNETWSNGTNTKDGTDGNTNTLSGTDKVTTNEGKNEVRVTGSDTNTASGTDLSTSSIGKIEVSNSGNDTDTASGEDNETIKEVRAGNIGVTSTQSLIQQERDIIVDVIDFYIAKFASAFDINNAILCGKWELE